MEASTVPQIQKREYVNQTSGWLGVVVLDPRGEERGVSVDPHGTVWLSDAEVILTARAPRDPKDNPFEEQTFIGINAAGAREEFKMRALIPADTDPRYVPTQERYVPPPPATDAHAAVQAAAAARDETVTSPATAAREAAIVASPPAQGAVMPTTAPVPVPAASAPSVPAAAPPVASSPALGGESPAAQMPDAPASWTEPPPAPGEVLPGTLSGSNEPPAVEAQAQAPDPTLAPAEATPPPQPPVPQQPPTAPPVSAEELAGGPTVPEEHAAAVDPGIGEETGAAVPPSGEPVQGEYAQAEEVGSPDAPAAAETE